MADWIAGIVLISVLSLTALLQEYLPKRLSQRSEEHGNRVDSVRGD